MDFATRLVTRRSVEACAVRKGAFWVRARNIYAQHELEMFCKNYETKYGCGCLNTASGPSKTAPEAMFKLNLGFMVQSSPGIVIGDSKGHDKIYS